MRIPTGPLRYTQTLHANRTGTIVHEELSRQSEARVIGSTSHGIFLLAANQRVIFVSYEQYCSPLTITLVETEQKVEALPVFLGQNVQIQPDELSFTSLGTHILFDRSETWTTPSPPETIHPLPQVYQTLKNIILQVMNNKRGIGFVPLLAYILDLPSRPTVPATLQPTIMNVLLLKQLFNQPLVSSAPLLMDLMGLGRGLTPSGDDLIVGLLLVLNRLPERSSFISQLEELNNAVAEMAYSKTTALSANLIDCAAHGSADERLIRAVDGILTGSYTEEEIAGILDTYGSSSGIDALAGMAIAIHSLIHKK
jgi:hypothetical protein